MYDIAKNSKYGAMLKSCRKLDAIVYVGIMLATVASIANFLSSFGKENGLLLFFDGVMVKTCYAAVAIYGIYRRKYFAVFIAPMIIYIGAAFYSLVNKGYIAGCNIELYIPLTIICAAISVYSNRTYLFLEQQEGFPYFNERYEVQKDSLKNFEENNPYEAASKERSNTSSDRMQDLF